MAEAKEKNKKIIISIVVAFITIGIVGGSWWWYKNIRYITTDDARVSGNIVNVSSKIPGKVAEVLVNEGEEIKKGQVIIRIDNRDMLAQRNKVQASLELARARYDEAVNGSRPEEIEQAKANFEQANANQENAYKNYLRMQRLYQEGAISLSQRDTAETAYLIAKESLKGTREKLDLTQKGSRIETIKATLAQVKQVEAELEAANLAMEYTEIIAPIEGVIAQKSVNAGENIGAGQSLFLVVNSKDIWLNARIEETKIGKIKIGQKAKYRLDGYNKEFEGTIYEIGAATNSTFALIPTENTSGNFTKVTQRIPIKITLPKDTKNLIFRPGMQALLEIDIK